MSGLSTVMSGTQSHIRWHRIAVIGGLMALVAVVGWFVAIAPAVVGFGLAVAAAVSWCIWLERHPEPGSGDRADVNLPSGRDDQLVVGVVDGSQQSDMGPPNA